MSSDYNLVVIGSTPEAIYAALTAARLKARVALVEQPFARQIGAAEAAFSRSFTQVARLSQQLEVATQVGILGPGPLPGWQLSGLQAWDREVSSRLAEDNSPAILSSLGVDFIEGSGEFCRLPQLGFVAGSRKLRARSYLIATGCHWGRPQIPGIEEVGYLTPTDCWQGGAMEALPSQLAVVGDTPMALVWAQNLRATGREVTLIVEGKRLLPQEELEAARLLQCQLEAAGVRLLSASPLSQVRQIGGKKWLQAGDWAVESEEILAVMPPQPNGEGLNLAGVGVDWKATGIERDRKLQTGNPRIYACGGSTSPHLNYYEATIAVKNALFFPWFNADTGSLLQVILTDPPLGRVGMTEAEARSCYGPRVLAVQQYYKTLSQAQVLGETTGFCKLIAQENGRILGGHAVGVGAEEFIGILALAIHKRMKISQLASLFLPQFTWAEILQKTAREWQDRSLQRSYILQNFLDSLFVWLRN